MIRKAYKGKLNLPDDVFDLPESLTVHHVSHKVSSKICIGTFQQIVMKVKKEVDQLAKLSPIHNIDHDSEHEQVLYE